MMEIFCFFTMGGKADDIVVLDIHKEPMITAKDHPSFGTFDVTQAQCFCSVDHDRFISIIEASYGDVLPFNEIVRDLLTKTRLENAQKPSPNSISDAHVSHFAQPTRDEALQPETIFQMAKYRSDSLRSSEGSRSTEGDEYGHDCVHHKGSPVHEKYHSAHAIAHTRPYRSSASRR